MELDNVKKIFTWLITALGLFVLIFIIVSIFMISRIAQKKDKKEIKKDYAVEVTPTVSPVYPIQ